MEMVCQRIQKEKGNPRLGRMNLKMTDKQLGEESRMCMTDCTGAQGKTKSQGSRWRWRELDQDPAILKC